MEDAMYVNLALVIVSIILICMTISNWLNFLKSKKSDDIIDRINHELQGVEGKFPHDQLKINKALNLTRGIDPEKD